MAHIISAAWTGASVVKTKSTQNVANQGFSQLPD